MNMTDAHEQMLSVLTKLRDCKNAATRGSIFIAKEDTIAITIALEHLVDYFKDLSEDMNIHEGKEEEGGRGGLTEVKYLEYDEDGEDDIDMDMDMDFEGDENEEDEEEEEADRDEL